MIYKVIVGSMDRVNDFLAAIDELGTVAIVEKHPKGFEISIQL